MIRQIKKKKFILYFLIFTTTLLLLGCDKNKNGEAEDSYVLFEKSFLYIKENLTSENFVQVTSESNEYYSASLPDNKYFSDKNDLYEDNPLKPKNRQLLYVNEKKDILISINYLYSEERLEKHFLTIDSWPTAYMEEQFKGQEYHIPYFDQFVMTDKHSIILLKAVYIGKDNVNDKEEEGFVNQVKKFIQDYTDCLNEAKN